MLCPVSPEINISSLSITLKWTNYTSFNSVAHIFINLIMDNTLQYTLDNLIIVFLHLAHVEPKLIVFFLLLFVIRKGCRVYLLGMQFNNSFDHVGCIINDTEVINECLQYTMHYSIKFVNCVCCVCVEYFTRSK